MSITKILFALLFVLAVFFSFDSSKKDSVSESSIFLKGYTAIQDSTDEDGDDDEDGGIIIPPGGDE